jgi:MOSC domain-containing protein YiiM
MKTVHDYLDTLPQIGLVAWIGLSPGRRQAIVPVDCALARVDTGLDDDYHARGGQAHRQVTLIQFEHLGVIASLVGRESITPDLVRRNIAVRGINLLALRNRRFRIGEAILEGTSPCDPCSRMGRKPRLRRLKRDAGPRRHHRSSTSRRRDPRRRRRRIPPDESLG